MFEFICGNKAHAQCVKTKRAHESRGKGKAFNAAQGRPIGWGVAWLSEHTIVDRDDHFNYKPDAAARIFARDFARLELSDDDFAFLMEKERPKRDGENSEPDDEP